MLFKNKVAFAPPFIHEGDSDWAEELRHSETSLKVSLVYPEIDPSLNTTV